MSTQFNKPENALKRAKELNGLGQKMQALTVLHSVITAKKFRTWSPVLENILIEYITLCVELRKGKMAKDGLHQFKVVSQTYNTNSLETVVKNFLEQAEERAKVAQSKADKVTLDIEDLEAEESAESMMLSAVSGEDSKDRTDREIVTPWLKFLWETYRTVLEILRNNNKLENLYQDTARRAFNFCLKYKRHTEFRRLSEMLRTHLSTLGKYQNQAQAVSLNSPETLQLHLDTRFAQLNAATELELWQESFRSIEDIHGLLSLSKKAPRPQIIANYYQKLAQIFWVSENYLFHAFAYYKFFSLSKMNKSLSEEEQKIMASAALLAALAAPVELEAEDDMFDFYSVQKERNNRMSAILSFGSQTIVPNREKLVDELNLKNIKSQVLPELKDFYHVLEQKFNPLQFSSTIKAKLDFIATQPALKQYVKPLEKLLFVRLLQQLSRVYEVMKISDFLKLVDFLKPYEAEKQIVEAVRRRYVDVRVDYQVGVLSFKSQALESEQLRNNLSTLSDNLQQAARMIQDSEAKAVDQTKQDKKDVFAKIISNIEEEHKRILARKQYIEKKKELIERATNQKMIMIQKIRDQEIKEAQEREKALFAKNAAEIERKKAEKEREAALAQERLKFRTLMASRGATPQDLNALDAGEIDPEEWLNSRMQKHEEKQSELTSKLRKLGERLDWLERAKRDEERPLLLEYIEKKKKEDEKYYNEQMANFLKQSKENHERDLTEKKRLLKMLDDKNKFESVMLGRRQAEYESLKKERDARLAEKKEKLREERERREKEEAERKEKEDAERAVVEAENQRKREEQEKKRQEDDERRAKLREQADHQRKREEAAMAKQEALLKEQRDADRERERAPIRRDEEPARGESKYVPPTRRYDDREPSRFDDRDRRDRDRYDDREPSRFDDRRGPSDRFERDAPRRGFDDRDAPRRGFDDRDAPRRGFDDRDAPRRGFDDRDAPRRGFDDRDAPRRPSDRYDDRDAPRRDDRPRFDDDRRGPRDDDRRGPRDDDRRGPRDYPRDREPARESWGRDRDAPRRDEPRRDRDEPERRSADPFGGARARDEPPRRDRDEAPRRDERRDDRDRRDERPPRRDDAPRDDRRSDSRRDEPRREERPPRREEAPRSKPTESKPAEEEEDDGFTTVSSAKGRKPQGGRK